MANVERSSRSDLHGHCDWSGDRLLRQPSRIAVTGLGSEHGEANAVEGLPVGRRPGLSMSP